MVVAPGVTTTEEAEEVMGDHEYEGAPEAVNVEENPAQITVGLPLTVTVGEGMTLMVTVLE